MSKSARASACLLRVEPTKSPSDQFLARKVDLSTLPKFSDRKAWEEMRLALARRILFSVMPFLKDKSG